MGERQSWIKVGPHGTFAQSGKLNSTPADIDRLLSPASTDTKRLLVHFHGGLVGESDGLKVAEAMAKHYGDAARSLSVVWETSALETLRDNIAGLADTKVFKKALSWVLTKVVQQLDGADGARGAAAGILEQPEIEQLLQNAQGVRTLDAALTAEAEGRAAGERAKGGAVAEKTEEQLAEDLALDITDLVDLVDRGEAGAEPILRQIEPEASARGSTTAALALFIARVVIAVLRRFRASTHHDPLPTAVEELLRAAYLAEVGAFAWNEMKRKAKEMWIDDGATPDGTGHVGGYILRRLEQLQQSRPDVTLDVVGHSAGSIVICAMLQAIKEQRREIRLRNVLFLAPAVRLDVFKAAVTNPLPFERFRLFTMTDDAEKADRLVGTIYPRSLLFLVSGLFEDTPGTPLAGLARHIIARTAAAGADYDEVRRWLAAGDRLVFSPSADGAPEGLRSRAARHGDFDDDEPTLASLLFLARAAA